MPEHTKGHMATSSPSNARFLLPFVCLACVVVLGRLQLRELPIHSQTADFHAYAENEVTRVAIGHGPWQANATAALQRWKANLMRRMFEHYTSIEAEKYQSKEGRELAIERVEPENFARYDLFEPIIRCPNGSSPGRVGSEGDGGKWLCMDVLRQRQHKDCLVYSVGSYNQFDFEAAMLQEGCTAHTFDCTSGPRVLEPGRHVFHPICLGNKNEVRKNNATAHQFLTLDSVLANNNHTGVDLLKMDIEGFEYEVMSGFDWFKSCSFPRQISMEIHWNSLYLLTRFFKDRNSWQHMLWPMHELSMAEMVVVFYHLADLGYAIVSKELNPFAIKRRGCCVEFTFLRVEQPAHCALLEQQQNDAAAR